MHKYLVGLVAGGLLASAMTASVVALPVVGYEALYTTLITSCSLPAGSLADCETAINAYSEALVNGGVGLEDANTSFSGARSEVFALNEPDEPFQADIDALFETLLPNSGAIAAPGAPAPLELGEDPASDQ